MLIHTVDLLIAFVFLVDFCIGYVLAKDGARYWKTHWFDLLAAIPISGGVYRSLRLLRLVRIVRVIRVVARVRKFGAWSEHVAEESAGYIYAATVVAVTILSAAVAFFAMEIDRNPNLHNFFDAIWWAVVTATTVGYGDIHPVTWEGRVVGMLLMFFGIGLVGSVAGLVGGHMLKRK